jgi:lysophospholipase L1-like esterase
VKPAAVLAALFACAAAAAFGWWAGARRVEQRFERIVEAHTKALTLGSIAPAEQRATIAKAYSDPASAERSLERIAWEPPKSPAPFVGYAPTPGEHANARHNSLGWRDARELARPKPEGVVRVFLTGGSTAYGVGAPSQETTVGALLEKQLNAELGARDGRRYEVFTTAAPAWASTHERIQIENLLSAAQADVIVALTGVNDVHWGWRGADVMWMRSYAEEYFKLLHEAALEAAGAPAEVDLVRVSPELEPVPPGDVGQRFERNQRSAWYAAATGGATYVVALQPCLAVTKSSRKAPAPGDESYFVACFDELRLRLERIELQQWKFVDLTRLFDADFGREHVYIDSYHFGDKGNERLARALFDALHDLLAPAGGEQK